MTSVFGLEPTNKIALTNLKVKKRSGGTEDFSLDKIVRAIKKCFQNNLNKSSSESEAIAESIGKRVRNILIYEIKNLEVDVEEIQKLVIQQLWASDFSDAAEKYTIFREQRKIERLNRPRSPEEVEMIKKDTKVFPAAYQYYQLISKYVRWNYEKERRETWQEVVDRVMGFFKKQPQLKSIPEGIWGELQENLFYLKSLPAMRIIQMAGPPLERCNVGAYNCSYLEISRLEAFSEILYILMQGTGVGFSVEERVIEKLPRVQKQNYSSAVEVFTIPDSTEGWCDALAQGIFKWFNGQDIKFNYDLIRPAGSILKRKGGRASGPEPLKQLLTFVRDRILFKQGEKLSALDCHDIACMIGKIVQVGGVRRSSEISLSDLNDLHMRSAKSNNWWTTAPWRDMANNSAVFNEKPDSVEFMQEWLSLAQSGSGERGIFNRKAAIDNRPERRKEAEFGTNPCAEIILRSEQFCNLSIVVARSDDTVSTLCDKVRIAAIFGTIQSTLTNFKYISKKWKENCEEERLLGVDITGQMDCPLLVPGAPGRSNLIDKLKQIVRETNQEFAALLGIPESAATTCLKPSGNSSQFLNCSSGIHARYSPFYIRRFRGSILDPVSKLLKDEGVPCHPDPGNPSNLVFEFPVASPKGSWTRDDQTAIDMLENWLSWKKEWAEHSVSCTIYVEPHEWLEVGNWVYTNFDQISGLSFLPKSGGNYSLAPYEEITEEKYNELVASFPEIDWSKLSRYEIEDYTTSATEYACVGGICEL